MKKMIKKAIFCRNFTEILGSEGCEGLQIFSQKMIIWGIFGVQSSGCTGEGAGVWACSVGGYRDPGHPAPAAGPTWQVLHV